jgi:ATP-binding cassette, subfamily B, bacterial
MIAKHYGKEYSIAELRKKSFINREGVSILGISEAAEAIGFRTLSAEVPFKRLKSDVPLPCIVHWSQRHFVVVYKATEKRITVADPAAGLINYTHEEFNKQWSAWKGSGDEIGVALFLARGR